MKDTRRSNISFEGRSYYKSQPLSFLIHGLTRPTERFSRSGGPARLIIQAGACGFSKQINNMPAPKTGAGSKNHFKR